MFKRLEQLAALEVQKRQRRCAYLTPTSERLAT